MSKSRLSGTCKRLKDWLLPGPATSVAILAYGYTHDMTRLSGLSCCEGANITLWQALDGSSVLATAKLSKLNPYVTSEPDRSQS